MALADSKKVQTMINRVASNIQHMREDMVKIKAVRDLYIAANVDPTGTPLEGKVAILNNAIASLDAELSLPVFDQLIAAIVPTHNGRAL